MRNTASVTFCTLGIVPMLYRQTVTAASRRAAEERGLQPIGRNTAGESEGGRAVRKYPRGNLGISHGSQADLVGSNVVLP